MTERITRYGPCPVCGGYNIKPCKCQKENKMESDSDKKLMIKNRLQALYHNCHAQAHFALSDMSISESKEFIKLKNKEAECYQTVACWIDALIKVI